MRWCHVFSSFHSDSNPFLSCRCPLYVSFTIMLCKLWIWNQMATSQLTVNMVNMYRGHLCCLSLLEEATFPCYLVGRIPGKCCLPSSTTFNRLFPSSPRPLYQNEGRCSAFDMEMIFHSHANKTHFHKKGRAPSLILKVRVFGTRK